MEVARTIGQQLQKYNPHVPRHTAPKVVLPEDVYVDQLNHIIRRDFFPDLVDDDDPAVNAADPDSIVAPPMSVNRFLANHTSEDNASFRDIVDRSNADLRSRTRWIDARADGLRRADALRTRLQLASADVDDDDYDPRPKHLDLLRYEPRNTLMFVADNDRAAVIVDRGDRIRHRNTRLTYDGASNLSDLSATTASSSDTTTGTPCFRGYKLVRSPVSGDADADTDRRRRNLPMDEDEISGPALFRVPDLPARDRLARRLGQAAAKSLAKRQRDQTAASPRTPSSSSAAAGEMSPAARRLLAKRQRWSGDHQLRASYTTPGMTPPPSRLLTTPSSRSTTPLLFGRHKR